MAELLLDVAWGCLSHPSYHNPHFDIAFSSEDVFVSTFNAAGLLFCSGLLETIQTGPPSLAWLASVSFNIHQDQGRVPYNSWGLYLHVFLRPGFLPLIYIGSATASEFGIRARFKDYRNMHAVSQQILDAIQDGFILDYTIILASSIIPQPADQPRIRALYLVLEAAFAAIFWCMRSITLNYGCLGDNSIWNREELPWRGLCTHSPLLENVKNLQLTPEELDAIAEEKRNHKNSNLRAWTKADNAKKRANPTPEFVAQRTKINKTRYKSKKKQRDAAVANKEHYCELCEKSYTSAKELEHHQKTPLHLRRISRGEKDFSCAPCGVSYPNKTRYDRHCRSQKHINNIS
jgi:hypothetical protein